MRNPIFRSKIANPGNQGQKYGKNMFETYYFLISFQESWGSKDNDNRITEILDVFDEISQLNQKYKVDEDNSVNQESLNDIHDFIEKSVQYIFNKKDDK